MGKFVPVGMRTRAVAGVWTVNTCSGNDTRERGDDSRWSWCNPTNRVLDLQYQDVVAVSVEALWQGAKLLPGQERPDPQILAGDWRKNKGRRPAGAYAGPGQLLITSPGQARRLIYLPAYARLIAHWLQDEQVQDLLARARAYPGEVWLRDYDTGQGLDRNGPMSHAWLLSVYLNTGRWPE